MPLKTRTCLLMVCGAFVATPCFAPWAKHEVVTPASGPDAPLLSVRFSEAKREHVEIIIPVVRNPKQDHKGYFLIRAFKRLPSESLEFRGVMLEWRYREGVGNRSTDPLKSIEEIRPLAVIPAGEQWEVRLTLDVEEAGRTYIVYDFKPHGGGLVMDGGLWVTYDLPLFIDSLTSDP